MKKNYLIEFICPKCELHIAWALPGATVICTKCGRKINKNNMKNQNPACLPSDSDQLILFGDEEI